VHAESPPNTPLNRKAQLYSSDPKLAAKTWLADIAALRRAGHDREADAEFRRFRSTYPDYSIGVTSIPQ
jgi:hypothetical protein